VEIREDDGAHGGIVAPRAETFRFRRRRMAGRAMMAG
jgi:hypothetical protein